MENQQHNDMLLPNVEDNYHTVGLKLLSSFRWITQLKHKNDLKWIIKIDDDVFVNVRKLDSYLTNKNINRQAIHCPLHWGGQAKPARTQKSKW